MVTPAEPVLKTKMPNTGGMKMPAQKMPAKMSANSSDIIEQTLKNQLSPQDVKGFMASLAALVQAKMAQVVQIGQTAFVFNKVDTQGKPLPEGTVMMLPFTMEPQEFPGRLKVLPNTLKQMGVKRVLSVSDSPKDVELAKMISPNVQSKQRVQQTKRGPVPMYSIQVDL